MRHSASFPRPLSLLLHGLLAVLLCGFFKGAPPAAAGEPATKTASAPAMEKVMEGGRSPDGAYELRIWGREKSRQDEFYEIRLYALKPEKLLFTLPDIGGYLVFDTAVERDHAWWHSSGKFVALTDQGSRHSRELYVLAVDENDAGKPVSVMHQPDFFQNALGRVKAVEIDFADVVNPQKWEGDDLHLDLHFTANHRISYTCQVVLFLQHGPQSEPRLYLKSVSEPEGMGG